MNSYSKKITQNPELPAAQAMLHAIGLTKEDFNKAFVGIASTGWEGNPCNMHLNELSQLIKRDVVANDLIGLVFNTIGVSDGISMGTSGMNYSLPSRDIIADSIETVVSAQWYDGIIAVVGCDKNMPGAMMALGRLNRPAIIVYGGTIAPGCVKERRLDIVSAFEALGEKKQNKISSSEYDQIIANACPGPGACGGMYTANTMASAIEAMGMSLPFNSSNPAVSVDKKNESVLIGKAIQNLLENDIKPRDIITRSSIENALRLITVLGGSTNAVIHMIAIAKSFDIEFTIDDIQSISNSTPYLADLKPSGKYLMQDLHDVGGIPAVMKLMLNHDLLNGDCMTVTGKTVSENLHSLKELKNNQQIINSIEKPIKSTGHIQILYGNLAKNGAVSKITGKEGEYFKGFARVFNNEEDANTAILNNQISAGDVLVIRYCGPKGGPGMPEMLKPTSLIMGAGLGDKVALITDGRFSGGTHGFVVGHITPEAYEGGLISLVEEGDPIEIDIKSNKINLLVKDDVLTIRRSKWTNKQDTPIGILKKYRNTVSSASEGCMTS